MTDKSQSEVKERREPRMTKNLGRTFERFQMAYADTMVRPMIIARTAVDTSPLVVISGQRVA